MAKPSRDRVRKWRKKKAEKGGRGLSTWLEPETAQMMDFLLDHYGETAAPLIARAVSTLYRVTCDHSEPASSVARNTIEAPCAAVTGQSDAALGSGVETTSPPAVEVGPVGEAEVGAGPHPLLQEIKTRVSAGVPFKELQKTLLVQWIKTMQAEGASFQEMTELLNAAAIPTPTGMGRWEQGMIPTVLLLSSF